MCQEDINVGRRTRTRFSSVVVTTTATKLVSGSADRIHITLSAPGTATVTVADSAAQAAAGGLILRPNTLLIDLDVQQHGQAVMGELWGIASTGSETIGILEVVQEYE